MNNGRRRLPSKNGTGTLVPGPVTTIIGPLLGSAQAFPAKPKINPIIINFFKDDHEHFSDRLH